MDLLIPNVSLLIWTLVSFIYLVLTGYAFYQLANNDTIPVAKKLQWLLLVLFVPLGPIIYLRTGRRGTNETFRSKDARFGGPA